jgi:hypothetical protein
MNGDVCCPTLLSQSCRYCGGNGHTVKFCKVLEKEQHTVQRNTNEKKFNEAKQFSTSTKPAKSSNAFSLLYSSDESEEDERPKSKKRKMTKPTKTVPEPTPVHTKKIQSKSDMLILSYASILSKEPTATTAPIEPIEPIQMPVQFPKSLIGKKSTFSKNWADAVDSDDEE